MAVNSRAEADFVDLGLELKVTAIKENKRMTSLQRTVSFKYY